MRMVAALNENIGEGAIQVQQTGVGGDAKIVYALLTGMVKDKVEYPVREYATNAWEVSPAGKPFEIDLPTRLNPQYRIRDFGPGISHKFMMSKYAKIGESTKDNDDEAVGGWGFGSKAGLAYLMRSDGAGSFTVISRYRGFRRIYIIGVNEAGKIQIQFMGEWPLDADDRGTGLEVSFAVRDEDCHRFRDHAQEILWSFHPRPSITPAIDFGKPRILHQGDGWTLYDPSTVPFSGPQVQLGPVMYALDTDLMPKTPMLTASTTIVFNAKIGSISVSASREDLQYDDRTEIGLRALFEHYKTDWLVKARKAVDAEPTYFKARWRAWDIADTLPNAGWGRGAMKEIGWRGFKFGEHLFGGDLNGRVKAARWPELKPSVYVPGSTVPFKNEWQIDAGTLEDRRVVIQHNSSRMLDRLTLAGLTEEKLLIVRCKRVDLDDVLNAMGQPEYVRLDDYKPAALPRGPNGERIKRPDTERKARLYDPVTGFTTTRFVDFSEEQFYMRAWGRGRKARQEIVVNGIRRDFKTSEHELPKLVRSIQENGVTFDDDNLVVILGEDDNVPDHWISFGDHLAELIDGVLDTTQVKPTIQWTYSTFPTRMREMLDYGLDLTKAPAVFRDIRDQVNDLMATRSTFVREDNAHDHLAKALLQLTGTDVKSVVKDPTQPVRELWNRTMQDYPLMPYLLEKVFYYGFNISSEYQRHFDHYWFVSQR